MEPTTEPLATTDAVDVPVVDKAAMGQLLDTVTPDDLMKPSIELYERLRKVGAINVGQFNGLGCLTQKESGGWHLVDHLTEVGFLRGLVVNADDPDKVRVLDFLHNGRSLARSEDNLPQPARALDPGGISPDHVWPLTFLPGVLFLPGDEISVPMDRNDEAMPSGAVAAGGLIFDELSLTMGVLLLAKYGASHGNHPLIRGVVARDKWLAGHLDRMRALEESRATA